MTGIQHVVLAYLIAFGLLGGYAVLLWLRLHGAKRRENQSVIEQSGSGI